MKNMKMYVCIWYKQLGVVLASTKIDVVSVMKKKYPNKNYPKSNKYIAQRYVQQVYSDDTNTFFFFRQNKINTVNLSKILTEEIKNNKLECFISKNNRII